MKHGHARHGTRTARATAGLAATLLIAVGAAAAVASTRSASAVAAQATASVVTGQEAASLYLQNCATCHGPNGEGVTDPTGAVVGPTLVGVGAAAVDFYLRTGRMPLGAPGQQVQRQAPKFDEAQIAALVEHVRSFGGGGPEIPQVAAGGDVRRGWELYTANCAACHAATGAGNAVGGGFVAFGLAQASSVEVVEATLIGPGAMPRFEFSPDEQAAIVAYVDYLRNEPAPGGAPIGGFGPVAEGFVAVVVGLTALVLVAMFVGRRSHGGEPADAVEPDEVTVPPGGAGS